jgi:hypothetical protein
LLTHAFLLFAFPSSGCTVPQVTYLQLFFGTLVMILIAGCLLILASGLFALTRHPSYLQATGVTRRKVFRWRVQNSMCVLGVVTYLQITTQLVRGVFCITLDDKLVLGVEPTTECYVGAHQAAVAFIWIALFGYSLGFPCLCLWLVLRTRYWNLWSSASAKFSYLYRNLKIDYIWYKCSNFLTSAALAIQVTIATTSNNAAVRLATACLFFGLHVFLVALTQPFVKWKSNLLAVSTGLANALSGLALLSVVSSGNSADEHSLGSLHDWSLFGLGIGVLSAMLILALLARYFVLLRYFPAYETQEEDELLQAGKYAELTAHRLKFGRGKILPKKMGQLESVYKESPELVEANSFETSAYVKNPLQGAGTIASDDPQLATVIASHDSLEHTEIEMQSVTTPTPSDE